MLESRDCPTVNVSVLAAFDGTEGQQDGSFVLFRDDTSGGLSVNYSLVSQPLNGGPIAVSLDGGPNPPPLHQTVTFAPGEDQATITLPMPQNDLRQGTQQVVLTLAPGVGYTIYQPEPDHVLLTDDEDDDSIWIEEIQNAVEGGDVGFVRVGRADPTGYRSVPYSILSGPDMATMGIDYAPLSGTLVFLPGQRMAEVVIDATGPFVDVAVEGEETVTLLFMPPPPVGPAQPPMEAKPIIRDARPGNDAPVFQLPPGKAFYEFYLGDLTPSNTYVDNVFATDADADEVTYSISRGHHKRRAHGGSHGRPTRRRGQHLRESVA
ncbi:MAG: Calx-beta domain-containing protein [Gemmataceae bacterium]